jgi:hypothetical protein
MDRGKLRGFDTRRRIEPPARSVLGAEDAIAGRPTRRFDDAFERCHHHAALRAATLPRRRRPLAPEARPPGSHKARKCCVCRPFRGSGFGARCLEWTRLDSLLAVNGGEGASPPSGDVPRVEWNTTTRRSRLTRSRPRLLGRGHTSSTSTRRRKRGRDCAQRSAYGGLTSGSGRGGLHRRDHRGRKGFANQRRVRSSL